VKNEHPRLEGDCLCRPYDKATSPAYSSSKGEGYQQCEYPTESVFLSIQ
jgi:hypothetical protein